MTPRSPRRWTLVAFGVAALVGLAIRVGAAITFPTWFDEATMGLMGRDVLHGQLPFFFYGQSFMGAIDGYLHAVTFAVLWESVATLRVMAILVSLGHVAVVALLARRVFGDGWWAAALALVPSAYALKWVVDARLVYGLILILVPLCLLLTLGAVNAALDSTLPKPGACRPGTRRWAVLVGESPAGTGARGMRPGAGCCDRAGSAGARSWPLSRSCLAALPCGSSLRSTADCPSRRCRSSRWDALPTIRAIS